LLTDRKPAFAGNIGADARAEQMTGETMRILVAEDDALLAEGLTRLLTKAGHGVDRVKDGNGADSALRATPYELLVLDIGLPDIDGFEVLRRLRQRRSQTNAGLDRATRGGPRGLDSGRRLSTGLSTEFGSRQALLRANLAALGRS
jgi:CheY-like chemotaxis protein